MAEARWRMRGFWQQSAASESPVRCKDKDGLAAERCGSAPWRNVLSVVRKSRNSSGGLYRCRRRSAHDRRRIHAVRFLMNTLLAHPIPSLIHAFPAKPSLGTLGSHAVFVSLRSPSLAIRGYRRGTITALNLLAPVQSCFSKLLAAGTLIRHVSKIAPCLVCASSRTVLFPDAEQRQG